MDTYLDNFLAVINGNLCYLDFSMTSEVKAQKRYGIIEAVVHIANHDREAFGKLYMQLGFLPADTNLEPIDETVNQ